MLEAVPESKHKKFWAVSAYMKETDGFTQARNAQNPASTPEASLASQPSADDSIAQDGGSINTDAGLIYETLVDMGVHKAAADSLGVDSYLYRSQKTASRSVKTAGTIRRQEIFTSILTQERSVPVPFFLRRHTNYRIFCTSGHPINSRFCRISL